MAGWKPHESLEESREITEMFIKENETWALYSKDLNKVIGSIGLHPTKYDNELMLGYVLSEEFWGKGIMLEGAKCILNYAFNTLKIDRIYVNHFSFNHQSKRVIERLGFKYIETKKSNEPIYNGLLHDKACYLLSKEEFNG